MCCLNHHVIVHYLSLKPMVVAWIPLLLISRSYSCVFLGLPPICFQRLALILNFIGYKSPWTLHLVAKCSHIISAKNWVFLLPKKDGGKPHHLQGPLLPTCWRTRAWRRSTRGWPRGSRVRWSTPERVWGSSTSSRAWPPGADHGWWLVGYNDIDLGKL